MYWNFNNYCADEFWNANLTWYTPEPKLTKCLAQVGFTIIPNFVLLLFLPFEVLHIRNSKNSKIQFNFYNILRLCLCFFGLLNNFYQNYFTLKFFFAQQQHIFYSEVVSSLIKTLSFMILFVILNYHRVKGIITCGLIWIYLFINTSCCLVLFLDVILYNMGSYNKVDFLNICFNFFINSILFILFFYTDDSSQAGVKEPVYKSIIENEETFAKQSPESYSSYSSILFYSWFTKLVWQGRNSDLTASSLWELEKKSQINHIVEEFNRRFLKEMNNILDLKKKSKTKHFTSLSFLKVLCKTYGSYFLVGTLTKFFYDIFQFMNPLILSILIKFVKDETSIPWHGTIILLFIFFVGTIKSILLNVYFERMFLIAMKIKSSSINLIYKKALKLNSVSKKERSTGEIVNLMAVDTNRFLDTLPFLNLIWSAPIQIIFGIYFLYLELGFSIFSGVAVIIIMIPINATLISLNKKYQIKQMKLKDERVKLMNEALSGIKVLKLYGWEKAFIELINKARQKETDYLKKSYYVNMVSSFLFFTTPVLVSAFTFAVYVFSSKENILTPEKAFVSLTLFVILQFPINLLPVLINSLILASVAMKRISSFLDSDELVEYITNKFDSENAISIEGNVNFSWTNQNQHIDSESKNSEKDSETNSSNKMHKPFFLRDINLKIKKKSFVAIIGQVGSGKSSLLSAFLGEMELLNNEDRQIPKINISEDQSISYASQQAWIQNNTLQKNILFGLPYDEKKYSKVINCCALEPDLKLLPGGDQTEIGEKGINLSGGQKQRISLARACYSDSNLVLLDDTLSAVDAHVGKHLIENVLSSETGLMKDKTRVLVTNQLNVLKNVDQIILLKDGEIIMDCDYEKFIEEEEKGNLNQYGIKLIKSDSLDQNDEKIETESIKTKDIESKQKLSDFNKKLIEIEKLEVGKVNWQDYKIYLKNAGYITCFSSLLFFIIEYTFSLGTNIFLASWSSNELNTTDVNAIYEYNKKELTYYLSLSFSQCLMDFVANFVFVLAIISTSIKFHKNLLYSVMRSPMNFFDTTPIGRILNRFSKDIDVIDQTIPQSARSFVQCFLRVFSAFALIVFKVPKVFVFFFIVLVIYYYIQKMFIAISRQLKRLDSITRSPIYSHFSETLTGSSTIKAYNASEKFIEQSCSKINTNNKCYWLSIVANRWLSLRLDFLGNIIISSTVASILLNKSSSNAGDVGLIVSYAMNVTQVLNWIIRTASELETNLVSVERVNEYCKNIEEDSWEKDVQLPDNWPSEGKVQFVDYSTRYRQETDLVIRNLNVDFDSLQKVGIVGRTGAGKSSITLALFRLIEPASGKILIDNVDITKLGLHDLRLKNQALSIIPQDPVLFTGTLRWNLDPFNQYTDNEIYRSLELAHLDEFVKKLPEGIMYKISEGGENLSVGQRQLVCLARALLKKSKILVLDEATASVDYATDELIQKTIRTEFKNCTTITIAHRINTILDSDKILVLDKGEKIEYENPNSLLADTSSQFYSLAKSANAL